MDRSCLLNNALVASQGPWRSTVSVISNQGGP
jgi:hypothetical protein